MNSKEAMREQLLAARTDDEVSPPACPWGQPGSARTRRDLTPRHI